MRNRLLCSCGKHGNQRGQLRINFHISSSISKSESCLYSVNALTTICRFHRPAAPCLASSNAHSITQLLAESVAPHRLALCQRQANIRNSRFVQFCSKHCAVCQLPFVIGRAKRKKYVMGRQAFVDLPEAIVAITRPAILTRVSHYAGAYGIEFDISRTQQEILLSLHHAGFETAFP